LTRELGFQWTAVRNGIADVAGVPPEVLRAFSRRRVEIEAELARRGTRSAAAAQVATLETRRSKDYRVTPKQLAPVWRRRAAALGLGPERVRGLVGRTSARAVDPVMEERVATRQAGPEGLTHRQSTFTPRDVIQRLCEELPAGAAVTGAVLEATADRFLRSELAVVLAVGSAQSAVLRRRDGRVVPLVADEWVYSTPELLARERRVLEYAVDGQKAGRAVVGDRTVERALRRRPTISEEQVAMVRRLTTEGASVSVVVGKAGAGKTFALAAAREAWEGNGYRVVGAALSWRAARELEDSAGIPCASLEALLTRLRDRPMTTLPPRRSVMVVDEAGMVSTRQLAELVDNAARLRAKLVLVGDDRQLAEIEAGGAFRALARRLPVVELTENRRQAAAWERDALALLRHGDPRQALRVYEDHGRVVAGESADDVRRRLVADWWAALDADGALMIAFRRVDVADLNGRARALMRASGRLGTEELTLPGGAFAVGDRVLLRRNDRQLGVANGDRAMVVAVDVARGTMALDVSGRRAVLDRDYLERTSERAGAAVVHGYAITGHSAQGLTCDRAFVLVTSEASREWCYTALSRGRHENRIYALVPEDERLEYAPTRGRGRDVLADAFGRSAAQTLASDRGMDLGR